MLSPQSEIPVKFVRRTDIHDYSFLWNRVRRHQHNLQIANSVQDARCAACYDELYVANLTTSTIAAYSPGDHGFPAPDRVISDSKDRFDQCLLHGLAVVGGRLFAGAGAVYEFDSQKDGDQRALAVLGRAGPPCEDARSVVASAR